MNDLEDKINALKARADEKRSEAAALRERAYETYREAARLEAEAASLVAPFKVGDVIEYERPVGLGRKRKMQKRRMIVQSMEIQGDRLAVQGRRLNLDGVIGYADSIYIGGATDVEKFLRVVKSRNE